MTNPAYQVEREPRGIKGGLWFAVVSLRDGHTVREWRQEDLAIAECRELNRLACEAGEAC